MCSRGRAHSRPPSASGSGHSSGTQYALCTLGVGLVALGAVMIIWTIVPSEAAHNDSNGTVTGGGVLDPNGKTSSVAFVLVGAGTAILLLAICLAVRSKRQQQQHRETQANNAPYMNYTPGEQAESAEEPGPNYDVPTYEEAVTSGQYPVRQSNLRMSTSQLPSYEDLVDAVENDGESQEPSQPSPAPAAAVGPAPSRHGSRSSRILRPFRVRRIKSEKLHLKDLRLNIRGPSQAEPVTIEPLTPPPQYEEKMPEFSVPN
ncbi:transmembrane protein 51b [Scleropages formosus]|uniref:Transmembrane protein 51b n=1 Tax=Scleropages formosus TaxID=113540 RepID=A0A8C9RBB7_SCLFO|nr:transmembrane protein 51-like [Scleropages formosus]XP_029103857.1 transmembrane protein 51-like [Scleropages formosus]